MQLDSRRCRPESLELSKYLGRTSVSAEHLQGKADAVVPNIHFASCDWHPPMLDPEVNLTTHVWAHAGRVPWAAQRPANAVKVKARIMDFILMMIKYWSNGTRKNNWQWALDKGWIGRSDSSDSPHFDVYYVPSSSRPRRGCDWTATGWLMDGLFA